MKAFDLNPDWLHYLETVARSGSIRQAAETLYLTEHSLRYNLKQLEQFLQTPPLIKTAQGLVLSPRGQELLASGFAASLECLSQDLSALAQERIELRLGISSAYPFELRMPILARLRRDFPGLLLCAEFQHPVEIEKRVGQGQYDLGLVTWAPNSVQTACLKGPSWPGVYVRRSKGPVAERYLLPPAWRYFSQEPIRYPERLADYPVRYIGSIPLILSLCLAGGGIGYLPRSSVQVMNAAGVLSETPGPELSFSLSEYLLAKDFETLSGPAAMFVKLLQAAWREPG